ncbi:MAG: hypothetical protein JXA72_05620 [Bacteroidales bacterium]|nr:hypothetical protein [Bacteroidales bacterium]
MRALFIITLLLPLAAASGQSGQKQITSLNEALELAYANNPLAVADSGKKKLTCQVKSSWFLLLFQIQKLKTLQTHQQYLHDLERVASLHYETGEIDYEQKSCLIRNVAEVETRTAISANNLDITSNRLRQLLFADIAVSPADSSLNTYQVVKGLAISGPMETELAAKTSDNALFINYTAFTRQKDIENLQLELDGFFIELQFFESAGLPHAATVLSKSLVKLKAEEYNYLEFSDKLSVVFKTRLSYLETLNKYNQTAILLEYYAY